MTEASNALQAAPPRRAWVIWVARILSALPVLLMLFSGFLKLSNNPNVIDAFTGKYGYPKASLVPIGVIEITSAVLYAIPRTAGLGALLTAAYLGGAVATHVRAGEPFLAPVLVGIAAWAGLYLRDERVRALLPLRRDSGQA
jgi:hypothetical protein